MEPKNYTTTEAAKKIGVSRQTLYSWIGIDALRPPKSIVVSGKTIRLWTESDIEKARKFKGTLKQGRPNKKKKH
jgi:DNA-binding transcriptional MerR regulator